MRRKGTLERQIKILEKARVILREHFLLKDNVNEAIIKLRTIKKRRKFLEVAKIFDAPHISDVH